MLQEFQPLFYSQINTKNLIFDRKSYLLLEKSNPVQKN